MTLSEIAGQLKMCGYECDGGYLENNVAFVELEKMARDGTESDKRLRSIDALLIGYEERIAEYGDDTIVLINEIRANMPAFMGNNSKP